ncbi:MAG: energy transducer TonB [Sphingomonas sp.]|uniref:energy transducer TonB n=1 Tax=Sphingomonas sp. TaxID=28214 RepID=UPI0025DD988D|nr:energy transducer TonB [Sphingomonas sp.]MBX3565948.1 energy transducer TonB [Sphingomonas sp.]
MYARIDSRSRWLSAAGALTIQGLLLALLIQGLGVRIVPKEARALPVMDFTVEPPPPEVEPERPSDPKPREEGQAAPPNLESRATEVAAPPPVLPAPPVMSAAPTPMQGPDASQGAVPVAGPGTGAGGAGDGTGSGGAGNGPGGGGGTVLRLLKGRIDNRDYPRAAIDAGQQGTVGLRFTVGVNGRVSDCRVTRSSGSAALDEVTCRLIQQRFRYAPSRDASGKPYADTVTGEQVWELYDDPEKERRSRPED